MRQLWCAAVLTAAIGVNATAFAQSPPAPLSAPALPAAPAPAIVPAGTIVTIKIVDAVSTRTVKRGDTFAIRLAAPILLGDKLVVPVGTPGIGQVVDAAPSGALGKPAKLLLAARYLDFNGSHLPLHTMRLFVEGQDNTAAIFAVSFVPYVGVLGAFAHGGEIEIPAGTEALAKLAADVPATQAAAEPPNVVASTAPQPAPAVTGNADEKGKTP